MNESTHRILDKMADQHKETLAVLNQIERHLASIAMSLQTLSGFKLEYTTPPVEQDEPGPFDSFEGTTDGR